MTNVPLYPYLGIRDDGKFELTVSTQKLNIASTRLEKGYRLPVEVYDQFQNPLDAEMAIDGLRSLQEFLSGKSIQDRGLIFSESVMPKRTRQKK